MTPFPCKVFFPGKIPLPPDKRSMKCTSSQKNEAAPHHVRQPKMQFKTTEKWEFTWITNWLNQLLRHTHLAWYCVCSWIQPSRKCLHTPLEPPKHVAAYTSSRFVSVNTIVRFADTADLAQCLEWTITEVSPLNFLPLKSCAKNWVANQTQHSRHSTQTKPNKKSVCWKVV